MARLASAVCVQEVVSDAGTRAVLLDCSVLEAAVALISIRTEACGASWMTGDTVSSKIVRARRADASSCFKCRSRSAGQALVLSKLGT